MKQEDKQFLLKDLCSRLPYNVICKLSVKGADVSITEKLDLGGLEHFMFGTMDIKPYLRPLSSMTEEEHMKLKAVYDNGSNGLLDEYSHIDWLLSHYFDFRGLIEKGLAIEAKEGMYKTEQI